MKIHAFYKDLAKTKKYPFLIRFIFLSLSSFIFQGFLYMDKSERIFKIMITLIVFIVLLLILRPSDAGFIILLLFLAHMFNWLFNGQIFVLLKNLKLISTDKKKFICYIENMQKRIPQNESIVAVAVYGSLSRENIKHTSDLDVRVIRKQGLSNALNSSFFVMFERTKAFFKMFPLDIYLLDDIENLHGMDEYPIIIYDPENTLVNWYKMEVPYWKY